MTEPTPKSTPTPTPTSGPSPEAVARWLIAQRWFVRQAGPGPSPGDGDDPDHPPGLELTTPVVLAEDPPVELTTASTAAGHRYQLLRSGPKPTTRRSTTAGTAGAPAGTAPPDTAGDAAVAKVLTRICVDQATVTGPAATVVGHWLAGVSAPGRRLPRPLGVDQTNTSTVVGGTHVLKVLRRLAPGIHPEVEVGIHLHHQAATSTRRIPVAPLAGWYELTDDTGGVTVAGTVHRLVPGALDGWGMVLSGLVADAGGVLDPLHRLVSDVADLYRFLARPGDETDSFGSVATTFDDIDRTIVGVTEDLARLEALVGHHLVTRTDRILAALAHRLAAVDRGRSIRIHGDLHLGQTVVGPDGWVILDFEGEPSRPLVERRRRHPALRDLAGLVRSLSYAVETVRRSGGAQTPGWEAAARAALLDGYLAAADRSLLPPSSATTVDLLSLHEIEKAVYEIGYEMAHRPDWVEVPTAGLVTVLDRLDRRLVGPGAGALQW